jgi:hypothetical protein
MHASPLGPASLTYNLNKQYNELIGEVSLNSTSHGCPVPLKFSIVCDGVERLTSLRGVSSQADTQSFKVDVKGVSKLELRVICDVKHPDQVRGAHSMWVEPYLVKSQ